MADEEHLAPMANEEHLARLKQGVAAWNAWRDTIEIPDLREADLRRTNLAGASLYLADLTGANLPGVNFTRADLRWAHLNNADLREAEFGEARVGWTTFGGVDLSAVHGLETVWHKGPSSIGIDTLYLSQGSIPAVFLQGSGVPAEMITYSKSLVGQPFQYYSCFISYSSRDEALAQRLYADLQAQKVRCWFAPEDLKIGDEFRSRIDESIQVYDRLECTRNEFRGKVA